MNIAQVIVDALSLGSLYAVFALGIALVFTVLKMINFAHSELVTVGAYVLILLADIPLVARLVALFALVILVAILMERVAFRPVRSAGQTTMLITSFGVSYLLQNTAILVFGPDVRSGVVWPALNEAVQLGPVRTNWLNITTIVVTALLLIGLSVLLRATPIGLQLRAASEDFTTARLVGVKADRVIVVAFAMSGALAATASFLLTTQNGVVTSTIGVQVVLMAFVATILGGMGSLGGAVLGGFLVGVISVLLQQFLPLDARLYRDALVFAAVFFVLVLRPGGLIVTKAAAGRV